MTKLKHIGIQIHPDDVNRFYIDVLKAKVEGYNEISADQSLRIFRINHPAKIVYVAIGDVCLELFLGEYAHVTSFQHLCLQVKHPEQVFRVAVERGFDGCSHPSNKNNTYFIKDKVGNSFEISPLL